MRRKVVIAGGRSKARSLALSMLKQGYEVTLINLSHQDCMELAMIESLTVIEGDATKPYVLEDAGIEALTWRSRSTRKTRTIWSFANCAKRCSG